MIVEQRTYTLFPGKTLEYLRLYESEGMAIQTRILGRLVGYFTTEIGPLNQIIHMWGYDSFEERARRRALVQPVAPRPAGDRALDAEERARSPDRRNG